MICNGSMCSLRAKTATVEYHLEEDQEQCPNKQSPFLFFTKTWNITLNSLVVRPNRITVGITIAAMPAIAIPATARPISSFFRLDPMINRKEYRTHIFIAWMCCAISLPGSVACASDFGYLRQIGLNLFRGCRLIIARSFRYARLRNVDLSDYFSRY